MVAQHPRRRVRPRPLRVDAGRQFDLAKEGVDLAVAPLRTPIARRWSSTTTRSTPCSRWLRRRLGSRRVCVWHCTVSIPGSTYLSGGWIAGCHQLAEATPADATATRIRRVILLTDGLANVGILDPGVLAQHAGELRRRGIATTTVGVGQDFDEGLLSAMAEAGGGNFQYVSGSEGLRRSSPTSCRSCSVAATGLTITLVLPDRCRRRARLRVPGRTPRQCARGGHR